MKVICLQEERCWFSLWPWTDCVSAYILELWKCCLQLMMSQTLEPEVESYLECTTENSKKKKKIHKLESVSGLWTDNWRENVPSGGEKKKWQLSLPFQKAEKPWPLPIACVWAKLISLGTGVVPIFQVFVCFWVFFFFFILNWVVFSLSAYCQHSRSKRRRLSNNWLSSPRSEVGWWVWLFLGSPRAVWEAFWP